MDGIIAIAAIVAMLLVAGSLIGWLRPGQIQLRWLLAAALLVVINDALLSRGYGLLPDLLPGAAWNWQGKLLALAATLAITAKLGWRPAGITLTQAPGSLRAAMPVAVLYCGFFLALALAFPGDAASAEAVAFQLSLPGLEEEMFYRGLLLLMLDRAFTARVRWLGVEWGWGALLSCVLFGLAHGFGVHDGQFNIDPLTLALTGVPSLLGVWMRLRTGSLLLPVLLHNFGNVISMLV